MTGDVGPCLREKAEEGLSEVFWERKLCLGILTGNFLFYLWR